MKRTLLFVCAAVLCCFIMGCTHEPGQTANESKFSPVCKTDSYYYDKDVSQFCLTVFSVYADISEQWELQLLKNQRWISVQGISPVVEDDADAYSFAVPESIRPLASGQYRLYDSQNLYASNTFAVGDLAGFSKDNLDGSTYMSMDGNADILMSVECMTKQFLLYSMTNLSEGDVEFGCGAWLEIQLGSEWYSLPEHIMFEMVNQHLAPGEEYREIICLEAYDVPLCEGKYRVVKKYDAGDVNSYAYTEFYIEQEKMEDTPVLYDALQVVMLLDGGALLNKGIESVSICYPEVISLETAETLNQQKWQAHYHLWCDIAPKELSYTFSKEFSDEECLLCLCYSEEKGVFWTVTK